MNATPLPPSDQPAKKKRRRRGSGNGPSGPVVQCQQVGASRLISLFLRSLSPKEKGFALNLLLKLAKECQHTAIAVSTTEGGAPC